ncbi:TrmH family RNA methyltransferase [Aeromicrobium sp.]|uniref:TrmH family RNA methyltransferase n=1 Tax=Aeromicrobium sp. TaxID=1871063 RepID=UPI0040349982
MARIEHVEDLDDPRLGDYLDLRDVQMRLAHESEHGIYLAEGEKVVRRAHEAGHEAASFLMAPRWLDGLADVLDASDAPCFVMDEKRIEQVTGFHVHRGALAAIRRPAPLSPEVVLADARRVVVLEDLVDHTNVGAVFRVAAALGFDAVLLSPRCADPFYRRAVKVAMGAVFSVPHARADDWYATPALLAEHGFTTYAMTLADDAVSLEDVHEVPDRLALVVGSEGPGLTAHWQRSSDVRVTIPMAAGIDSLNVATSVAVACWHLRGR